MAIFNEDIYNIYESNVRSYCVAFPSEYKTAKNAKLFMDSGQEYIDFLAGCGSLNYGHNDPDMKQALLDYIAGDGIAHSLDLHTEAKRAFITLFATKILIPRGLDYKIQFTGPTGANAVEAALKLARKVTGRSNVIAFTNGFHGVSLGALAATGNSENRQAAGLELSGVTRFPYDGYFGSQFNTCLWLERMLSDPSSGVDAPAAFIVEVVQGEGGLNVASSAWLRRLRELADKHGALLIIDDIQAGCGRTGTFFSFEPSQIVPDIVVLAKSFSGFGLPLSAILIGREFDVWNPAEHNGTFRGNNHAFVAASVAISKFWSDDSFAASIAKKTASVELVLNDLQKQTGWRRKGRGLMQGLETPSRAASSAIRQLCFQNGLLLEACGPHDEVLKLVPPLTIESELLDEGLSRFTDAVLTVAYEAATTQLLATG
ncbi:diaminobutyrate--2-oxoglutarate transaminase [Agrobacterium vitis]|uniref:diaminobutyrate--2-oxoglutarate transaminase n=1 Tax=Agrobacterium vitis TaxID=373 RepID=UPI001F2C44BD|nr:diaminobutyrate--2-oxoglutarate transaminase [Agrobacterium vitis]MCF1469276.1 diaminobutyrate--2-oxoglutarate transaminase [Agrobacterium vitis]